MPIEIGISTTVGGIAGNTPGGTPPFSNVNSFSFDGFDEYFLGTSTYSELDGLDNFAFSFWIKPSTLASFRQIITIGTSGSDYRSQQVIIASTSGRIQVYVSSVSYYWNSTASLTQDVWQHILVTRDSSRPINQKGKVYINGVDASSADNTRYWTNNAVANSGLMIGRHNNGWASLFSGKIDEIAVYTQDMASYISEIYGGGQAVDLNNLATAPQPTTWQRMGDLATWNGATWAMTDVNGGYTNRSVFMVEANRSTDVPTIPFSTKSILLDGFDDRVQLSSDFVASSEFTVSFWMKPTAFGVNGSQYVLGQWGVTPNNIKLDQAGQIHFKIGGTLLIISEAVQGGSNNLVLNIWQHLLFVRDSSNNIKCFRNGVPYGSTSGLPNSNTLTYNSIGRVYSNTFGFSGGLDEIAFWNSDQSANATSIYNGGVPNDISSLSPLSWWRCGDGDTAPTLTDNGSASNDGTMTNFTTFSTDVPT
jgi:hypothetical protein